MGISFGIAGIGHAIFETKNDPGKRTFLEREMIISF
jgi:hypothetical protein